MYFYGIMVNMIKYIYRFLKTVSRRTTCFLLPQDSKRPFSFFSVSTLTELLHTGGETFLGIIKKQCLSICQFIQLSIRLYFISR